MILAVLFGGGLVVVRRGRHVSGGLIDAISGNGGGGGSDIYQKQAERTSASCGWTRRTSAPGWRWHEAQYNVAPHG